MASATVAGDRARLFGSVSTKTGSPPAWITAAAVAKNVLAGTMTVRPSTPTLRSMISRAAVPLATATAWAQPWRAAKACSKRSVTGPRVSDPVARALSTMAAMAARSDAGKTGRAGGTTREEGTGGRYRRWGPLHHAGRPPAGARRGWR